MKEELLKYLRYFNMMDEREDFEAIHQEVEKGIVFKGTNLWILICAILVASVGLNMNSTAVIIGAMLISPLMGPINGMGYSLATYDFDLFKKSVKNLTFAILVSLLTSALYFFISPVSSAHSELLARTSPTIYDVFIALFGGVAGMLALSSKLKGNVIPGVAIATALMPPICTAGYGLATLQFSFFFGALYLFTINTVFIAVGSLVVSQVLKFPIRNVVDKVRSKKINRYITATLLVTTIPSVYFGYQLVQNENFSDNAKRLVEKVSVQERSYLIENQINVSNKSIQLIYSGYGVSDETRSAIKLQALALDIDTSRLTILNATDVDILREETQKIQSETDVISNQLIATQFALNQAEASLDSIKDIDLKGKVILNELKEFYPQILSCAYTITFIHPDTTKIPLVIYTSNTVLNRNDRNKIINWTKSRLKDETAKVYFEKE
ncbi:MAG TPA: TIGR00341 family protein [Paludibacter sp.]|nr:TIGR00341 family protein [Paludibacter sp.]HOS44946.1 TIGR00341 family protein [Paludibacter sp.]HPM09072.1 TIGR00341 family protein [Paludibacter sp.]